MIDEINTISDFNELLENDHKGRLSAHFRKLAPGIWIETNGRGFVFDGIVIPELYVQLDRIEEEGFCSKHDIMLALRKGNYQNIEKINDSRFEVKLEDGSRFRLWERGLPGMAEEKTILVEQIFKLQHSGK